jgi:hypothetical protein
MMGRNAAIEFYGYEYLVSVEDAGANDGIEPDDIETSGWFPHYPFYREDATGGLLYFYQPMTGSLAGVRNDIEWIRAHPRPHFGEVFTRVDLREEWPPGQFHTVKTLHHVTLLEALDELVTILKAKDAAIRARDQAERRRRQAGWRERP